MQGTHAIRIAAALLAAAIHASVIAWLLAQRVDPPPPAGAALQVTWIEPPPVVPAARPASLPQRAASAVAATRAPAVAATRAPVHEELPGATVDAPDGARLMQQARAWAWEQDLEADFRPDPLRHRPPPPPDGRFAMRDPPSVADVARGIGQLFAGPGYTTDPCPRVRQNIGALGSGGRSELLDEELRRLRKLCL